jgi:hypothetical protein
VQLASVLVTSVLAVEIGDKQQAVSSRQQIGRKFINKKSDYAIG